MWLQYIAAALQHVQHLQKELDAQESRGTLIAIGIAKEIFV